MTEYTDDQIEKLNDLVRKQVEQIADDVINSDEQVDYLLGQGWSSHDITARITDQTKALDVWLRIPGDEEEAEAEANTFVTDRGYRVDWDLTAVGLVTSVHFDTLAEAHAWLVREGFADFTS